MQDAFRGADKLLLVSATRLGARVVQHKTAIDAAAAQGVRHVVYTSFVNVDPRNPAIVTADHRETENLIRASGMAWTFLHDAHFADALILSAAPGFIHQSRCGGRKSRLPRRSTKRQPCSPLTRRSW